MPIHCKVTSGKSGILRPVKLHNRNNLRNRRKLLRKRLTSAEAYLWKHFKGKKLLGRKFRRQLNIGPFIVDFYYPKEKLIIELDGEIHNNPNAEEYDQQRSNYLIRKGCRVVRFENRLVFDDLSNVLLEIQNNFQD